MKEHNEFINFEFLDLESWLKIHYPQIFLNYENTRNETLIQE